ncbi:MAG: hypothetical protein IJT32_06870 [Lachnospiraceae bacterium]|nr:hypothetical protein [Lachnospiraceae bacterium]
MDDLHKLTENEQETLILHQEPFMKEETKLEETALMQSSAWIKKQGAGGAVDYDVPQETRMTRMAGNIISFAEEFQNEWGKPIKVEANAVVRGVNLLSKKLGGDASTEFTLNSFAYGTEVFGAKKDEYEGEEKRSDTAMDLMDSLTEWFHMTHDKSGNPNMSGLPDTSESMGKLYELAQTAGTYVTTHQKKGIYGFIGKGRTAVAEKVQKMVAKCAQSMLTEEEKNAIYLNDNAQHEVGESDKTIEKTLKKGAKAYLQYRAQIIKMSQGYMPGQEILEKKYNALVLYDREIRLYRDRFPVEADRNSDINEMIKEYEECLVWKTLFAASRHKEEGLTETIENHMEEEGEIESTEKYKNVPKDDKEELSSEQLKGINEIDRWMIRNFQNGGLAGLILPFVKNTDGELVARILSLSKRERLHMYYLVEMERRRDANISDVGISQNYVPSLDGFKNQILATELKFWKRATGAYTYMHKLTDAYHVTMQYRKEVNAITAVERKEQKKGANAPEGGAPDKEEEKILSQLVEFKHALEAYRDDLKAKQNAKSKREKAVAESKVNESRAYCERLAEQLRTDDSGTARDEVYMNKKERKETEVKEVASNYSIFTKLPNLLDKKLLDGAFQTGTEGAVALLGAVTSTITLIGTGAQMSNEERAEKSLQIIQSTYTAVEKGLMLTSKFFEGAKGLTAAADAVHDLAGGVGVVISTGVAVSQLLAADKMRTYGGKAGDYFKQKREKLEKQGKDKLTKQQKRELKYEKNMMKLQQDLTDRQMTKAIYSSVGAGIATVGLMVPGIGQVTQVAGAIISIVGSIHDIIKVGKLQTTLFDNFFNLDALAEKVVARRYKNHMNNAHNQVNEPKERVKAALRSRIAAYAGFSNMKVAAEFISSKFARLIREKLFNKGTDPAEKEAYITFVKALNLRYNEEKGLPDEHTLVRKMSAS